MSELTHDDLVLRAARWLLNTKKCRFVTYNTKPWSCSEHPDAIGWDSVGQSIVVEVKMSRADYYADRSKPWRSSGRGMGFYRYYLTPPGLLEQDRHFIDTRAGLLETTGRIVKVICEAQPRQDRDFAEEIRLLLAHTDYRKTQAIDCGCEQQDG